MSFSGPAHARRLAPVHDRRLGKARTKGVEGWPVSYVPASEHAASRAAVLGRSGGGIGGPDAKAGWVAGAGQTVVVAAWSGRQRFGAVDVCYPDAGGACAALVVAGDERFAGLVEERTVWLPVVEAYQPGRFYLRELPAITAVLATVAGLDLVVVDGYVDLNPQGRPGLGAHLHAQIGVPVIGVAKTAFRTASHAVTVHRGTGATRPLFVTAAGVSIERAAALVAAMAGPHRIPDALRRADTLARQGAHR
jgi:deoxyribonuclease V